MTHERIHVWLADNGNIRKWQATPFPEGAEYVRADLLAAAQGETREMRAELSAWRELHAAATVGTPGLWPNVWRQDVAAVAFVIHQQRDELARVRELLRKVYISATLPRWANDEVAAALSQPAEQQNAAGDWHCQNCGYIADQRVTFQETCDTCRQPVEWHAADPAAWQWRHRALPDGNWSEWAPGRAPSLRSGAYEVQERPLFAASQPADIKSCHECGSNSLEWAAHIRSTSGALDGRLRASEMECFFALGCKECSGTLIVKNADEIAAALSQPAELPRDREALGFASALKITQQVMTDYKAKHPKWWRRLDGTPIINDLPVLMAEAIAALSPPAEQPGAYELARPIMSARTFWRLRDQVIANRFGGGGSADVVAGGETHRVADTDEHGLPVIERTAEMPQGATHKITWLDDGEVELTDSTPIALEANRSGGMSERIEDYNAHAEQQLEDDLDRYDFPVLDVFKPLPPDEREAVKRFLPPYGDDDDDEEPAQREGRDDAS